VVLAFRLPQRAAAAPAHVTEGGPVAEVG
jgi:hypothetical protein